VDHSVDLAICRLHAHPGAHDRRPEATRGAAIGPRPTTPCRRGHVACGEIVHGILWLPVTAIIDRPTLRLAGCLATTNLHRRRLARARPGGLRAPASVYAFGRAARPCMHRRCLCCRAAFRVGGSRTSIVATGDHEAQRAESMHCLLPCAQKSGMAYMHTRRWPAASSLSALHPIPSGQSISVQST
jgi:hypothetical protein